MSEAVGVGARGGGGLLHHAPAEHSSFAGLPGMWGRPLTVNGFSKVR
jgi:hypothetical protein